MTSIGKIRLSTQILTLILVNIGIFSFLETGVVCPVFYCYGCPAAGFACPIGSLQNFVAVREELRVFPFYVIGSLGLFGITLGRFWCGWACPFGSVQDVVMRIRRRSDIANLPPVPWTKYLVFIGIFVAAWIALDTLFCKVCPAGSLFAAIPHRFISPELSFGTFFWVHIATLVVALITFYFIGRFWCRYWCPLGAIFGLFNRVSFLKVKLDVDKCNNCEKCLGVCPTSIQKPEDIGNATDCIQCGKCIDSCPVDALRISVSVSDRG